MKKVVTYVSGRAISLMVVLSFNVLLVKLASPVEYALYAVLIAGGSIANTLAGLGSSRLIPKVIGMASRQIPPQRASHFYRYFLLAKVVLLLLCGIGTFAFYRHTLNGEISLAAVLVAPFLVYATASSLYLDTESASQTLDQQRLSRLVAIGEPTVRLIGLIALALGGVKITGETAIWLSATTQVPPVLILAFNNIRRLGHMPDSDLSQARTVDNREFVTLGISAYLGGIAWVATAAPTLRIVAATFLTPTALAALSFVQNLGASLQRFSPASLLLPFVEPQVMNRQGDGRQEVVPMLSLVWKIDVIFIFLILAGISPATPLLLSIISRPEFAPFGFYLGLVLLPPAVGTIFRTLEVASVFADVHGAIAKASIVTLAFFIALYAFGARLGVLFVLTVPIFDSLARCLILWLFCRREGMGDIVQLRKLVPLLAGAIAAIGSAHLATQFSPIQQLGAGVVGGLAAIGYLWIVSPFSEAEVSVIAKRLPARFAWIGKLIAGSRKFA